MSDLETRLAAALRTPVRALTAQERSHVDAVRVPPDLSSLWEKADREGRIAIRRVESMRNSAHLWPEDPWRAVPTMREVRKLSCVGPKAYRSLAGLIIAADCEDAARADAADRWYRRDRGAGDGE